MPFDRRPSWFLRHGAVPFRRPLDYVPVALWLASFLCDIASLQFGNPAVRAAFVCLAGGVAIAIVLTATAMHDYNHVASGSPARAVTVIHAAVRAATLVSFALGSWVRAVTLNARFTTVPAVVLSGLGLLLVAWTYTLGNQVTFDSAAVIHLVHQQEEEDSSVPPGVIPFRRPRHT